MEIFFIMCEIIMFLIIVILCAIIKKLLKENQNLIMRNVALMKAERNIKNILIKAEQTNEFAVHTVQKIKSILSNEIGNRK